MKKIFTLFVLLGQFLFLSAQNYQLNLEINQVAEMSFAPFIFSNDLSGAPRIFAVSISPEEGKVKVRGEVFWQKDINSGFEWLLTFRTKVFTARSFFNTDLGTTIIPLGRGQSDSDLIEENRKRGKPSGNYQLIIYLLDEAGNELASDTETYEFSNPAQTLTILSPLQGSLENIGGVLAEWTELDGIQYYQVLANVNDETSQSYEDALTSGDPVINNVQVGLATSVDLRTLLTREWLPGQEIVLQVSALPEGGSPADLIKSDIIGFYLDDPTNPFSSQATEEVQQLLQALSDGLGNELLDKLLNGNLEISAINWEDSGLSLSPEEIQDLLEYLRQNPGNLISIEQD